MSIKLKLITFVFFIPFVISLNAQNDSSRIHLRVEGLSLISNGKLNPIYSYSNKWGIVDPFVMDQSLMRISMVSELLKTRSLICKFGIGGVLNNHIQSSSLHEMYFRGKIFFVDYSLGKEAFSPLAINDSLTTGMFLNSTNCAPYPRLIVGVFDYLDLPFSKGWIEFKGGMAQSVLDDNRGSQGKSYPLLHEKFFYLRLGNRSIQPYAGMMHSAIFGGKYESGQNIPIDFIATFFAKGSTKLGGGEATNAAGAHMGFFDFGVYGKTHLADFQFYYQKPIRDGSSLFINKGQNRDHIIGLIAYTKNMHWLKTISLEVVKTTFQSGSGVLDMSYPSGHPKAGQLIFPGEIKDYDKFMHDEFGMEVHGWDRARFVNYFEQTYNHGMEYAGRDNYMNNGLYYKGWSYHNLSMGSPLMHTADQYELYSGNKYLSGRGYFVNNRLLAYHIGVTGDIIGHFSYLAKFTFSENFGSYQEEYNGSMSWEAVPNYFYKGGKIERYGYLEMIYSNLFQRKATIKGFIGCDWGELYNSFSSGISFVYNISLINKK